MSPFRNRSFVPMTSLPLPHGDVVVVVCAVRVVVVVALVVLAIVIMLVLTLVIVLTMAIMMIIALSRFAQAVRWQR